MFASICVDCKSGYNRTKAFEDQVVNSQMMTVTHTSRQSQHDLQLLVTEAVWSIEQN